MHAPTVNYSIVHQLLWAFLDIPKHSMEIRLIWSQDNSPAGISCPCFAFLIVYQSHEERIPCTPRRQTSPFSSFFLFFLGRMHIRCLQYVCVILPLHTCHIYICLLLFGQPPCHLPVSADIICGCPLCFFSFGMGVFTTLFQRLWGPPETG